MGTANNIYSGLSTVGKIQDYVLAGVCLFIGLCLIALGGSTLGDSKKRKTGLGFMGSGSCMLLIAIAFYMMTRSKMLTAAQGVGNISNLLFNRN